ncbi:MAG: response regulator [Bdellovibrionota bacterium]
MNVQKVPTSAQHKKVLVVDDEGLIRWSLKEHLTQAGFDVVEAENGKSALGHFTGPEEGISAVCLDYRLPDMTGLDVLREIKKHHPDCPVIMMSAHGTPEVVSEACQCGAYHFADKPFDYEQMVGLVRKSLSAN